MPFVNQKLEDLVKEVVCLCKPSSIYVCNGSEDEYDHLASLLVDVGTFIPLKKRKNSYYCRSDPSDVARLENCTFICTNNEADAGPMNNWKNPKEMKARLSKLFDGSMQGRTLYIIPYCMGPLDSPFSKFGIELTDSAYVVCNMHIMTTMGDRALERIEKGEEFVAGVHSVGSPLEEGKKESAWPCNETKLIVHFPEEKTIWSFGSGYGGNALLGKKCFALRIASYMAKEESWMAEHMLILGLTNPEGRKRYIVAAFPSACGKTNLAMMKPSLPGWKVECVGDDIAWLRIGTDGNLYAINPERGAFGVAPGTSLFSNPSAMKMMEKNSIFTNVALTSDGDVWWEGMTEEPPQDITDWKGNKWKAGSKSPASHPNARFTSPLSQCPCYDKMSEDPYGVKIDAIIFGGRRATTTPLVVEAESWNAGTLMGAMLSSEMTAAAAGTLGKLRHDPMAMLPFCGYHMGDYFNHWVDIGEKLSILPRIYSVNWFRKSAGGEYLWPGFGENARVLKWIFQRVEGEVEGHKRSIGILPKAQELDISGLDIRESQIKELTTVDPDGELKSLEGFEEFIKPLESRFPLALRKQMQKLKKGLVSESCFTKG